MLHPNPPHGCCPLQLSTLIEHTETAGGVELFAKTALVAAHRPVSVLLPLLGADFSLLVGGR